MARVPYLDREDLPPEDRDIYDGLVAKRGFVANLFRVLANAPGLLRRLLAYSDYVRHDLGLDPHLRELAILTVGRVCRVDYAAIIGRSPAASVSPRRNSRRLGPGSARRFSRLRSGR